jgi:chloride channel protein, CIC family
MSRAVLRPSGEVIRRTRKEAVAPWALALLVGLFAGSAVVTLRVLIAYVEFIFFGAVGPRLTTRLVELSWLHRLVAPIVGGCIVALLLRLGMALGWGANPRPFGLDDLVAARRLRTPPKAATLTLGDSLLSALASAVSLGSGASVGREAAAAHLASAIALLPGRLFGLDVSVRRILLGMGVAAGLAAALHTPIAAVLFARELILPRQRMSQLGPIGLCAFVAFLTARGVFPEPVIDLGPISDVPAAYHAAAVLLAAPLAGLAWSMLRVWSWLPERVEDAAHRSNIPVWLLPALGGIGVGVLAVGFPPAVGLGFTPLSAGLAGNYSVDYLLLLTVVKMLAASLALSCRFGGGPWAPMLFIAGMSGSALGLAAALVLGVGDPSLAQPFFGALAMGVAVAVMLDAPLAAAVFILELSGSFETAAASFVAASFAAFLARRFLPPLRSGPEHQPLRWR